MTRFKLSYTFILLVVITLGIYAKLRFGSRTFIIEDATKPATFVYKEWIDADYTTISVRLTGDLDGGFANVEFFTWDHKKDTTGIQSFREQVSGKFKKAVESDYFDGQAYIIYKPKRVTKGKVQIKISIS